MRPASLQQRLLARTLLGLLLVWALAAAQLYRDADHELEELLDAHLTQSAALLIGRQSVPDDDDEGQDHEDAPALHKYAPQVAYQVYEDGVLVQHSPNATRIPLGTHTQGFATVTRTDGQDWRVFAARGPNLGVQVYVAERMQVRERILRAILRALLQPLALALPLLGLGLWWSIRQGLQPLAQLRAALRQRGPQALQPLELPPPPAELQPLVDALNELLLQLQQRLALEQRFTADAAHELRTPIAAIRAHAQVALHEATSSAAQHQALQDTLKGCDRATHLVEQLLVLSRVDGQLQAEQQPFGLHDALQPVCAELAPLALQRGQTLEVDIDPGIRLRGQAGLWQILMRNLIDNALRYTPAGGRVLVSAQLDANSRQLRAVVQDSGPGLNAADQARLGERFFRVLGTATEGSGLGWSIVRRVAALQGLDLHLERSAALGGLQVTVSGPV